MSGKKRYKDKIAQKALAEKRIKHLFLMAEKKALVGDLGLANRYVDIARKISMRTKVPIPKQFKRRFCKYCNCYMMPDLNSRFRIYRSRLVIYCKNCKKYTRIPLKKA